MKNTCCDKCRHIECPNKIESYWKDDNGDLKVLTDCAPKRSMLMLQEFSNQMVTQQASIEQLRNQSIELNIKLDAANARFSDAADQLHHVIDIAHMITSKGC